MSLGGDTRHVKPCSRAKFNETVLKESYLENLCEFDKIIGVVYGTVSYSGCSKVCRVKMARAINDSDVLTMGAMIVAQWMGKEMVDVWMKTSHTEGLEQFGDFLKDAVKQVDDIDQANRK